MYNEKDFSSASGTAKGHPLEKVTAHTSNGKILTKLIDSCCSIVANLTDDFRGNK